MAVPPRWVSIRWFLGLGNYNKLSRTQSEQYAVGAVRFRLIHLLLKLHPCSARLADQKSSADMVPPQYQSRFKGDSGADIACQELDVLFTSGEKRRIVLRLGAPFQKPDSRGDFDWWIRSELENLDPTEGPFFGCGSMDTLVAGIRWITARLDKFRAAESCRYYWPGTEDEFDYHEILSGVFRKDD